MKRSLGFIVVLIITLGFCIQAQETTSDDLSVSEISFTTQTDAFGQMVQGGEGTLTNNSSTAYTNLTIFADLLNEDNEVIGEGFGVMVNACGTGLLPDFALQPGESQPFTLSLDFFNTPAEVADIEAMPQGTPVEPEPATDADLPEHIRHVDTREVVNLEWLDANSFRYAVGCEGDVFTQHDWFGYRVASDTMTELEHPAEANVTEALLQQLGLQDPLLYNHSFLTYAPTSRRIVYQTGINELLTAEPDGSFKRLIYENLGRYSLRGFIWLPEGRFLAYYFGAIGDPVRYFTASVEGQRISADITTNEPSFTIPGPSPDGARAVVTLTENDVTGYYVIQTLSQNKTLLLEADPPGNNWPAPIYVPGATFGEADIYIARPVDGQPRLQCVEMESGTVSDLSELPLNLTTDDRAMMWLSPDGTTLALAANGVDGGLWLIGLMALGGCGT